MARKDKMCVTTKPSCFSFPFYYFQLSIPGALPAPPSYSGQNVPAQEASFAVVLNFRSPSDGSPDPLVAWAGRE